VDGICFAPVFWSRGIHQLVTKPTKTVDSLQKKTSLVTWVTTIFLPEKDDGPIVNGVHSGGGKDDANGRQTIHPNHGRSRNGV
jgi:hypothetical protein